MKKQKNAILALATLLLAIGQAQNAPASVGHAHPKKATKAAGACAPKPTPTPVAVREETISGTITDLNGETGTGTGEASGTLTQYGMELRADDGTVSDVEMVAGSLLYPPGARLKWGMRIKVVGHTEGCTFVARKVTILSSS